MQSPPEGASPVPDEEPLPVELPPEPGAQVPSEQLADAQSPSALQSAPMTRPPPPLQRPSSQLPLSQSASSPHAGGGVASSPA